MPHTEESKRIVEQKVLDNVLLTYTNVSEAGNYLYIWIFTVGILSSSDNYSLVVNVDTGIDIKASVKLRNLF